MVVNTRETEALRGNGFPETPERPRALPLIGFSGW